MYKFNYLKTGEARYDGRVAETVEFVTENQLKDRALWKQFVDQYRVRQDSKDLGWRGEYWGKMMRGGCLTYLYTGDGELYEILKAAVEGILSTQDEKGRISTYSEETEFTGWDMWGRKYVFTGLEHFLKICKDDSLKERIIEAMRKAANYILDKIGEDKKDIRKTSHIYGGVNSCSILEPIVELYRLTDEERYLRFAEYILSTGGCADGDLLEYAAKDDCYPYQYPENKAYETMSFFEGVLAYYEVTGKEKYFDLVKSFAEKVYESDITVIGCAGGLGEHFNNAAVMQTEPPEWVRQETCVTVTWMRLLFRLYRLTGEEKYAERIEKSSLNAMWGSLNENKNLQYVLETEKWVGPLTFDSYSPLVYEKRGVGVGGFREYGDGKYYGCCACIGSAGIAIPPLYAVMRFKEGFVINAYFSGHIITKTPCGNRVKIEIESAYPCQGRVCIKIEVEKEERFIIKLRKPAWTESFCIKEAEYSVKDGYIVIDRMWEKRTEIETNLSYSVKEYKMNGKSAFTYGPLVLALDEAKGNSGIDGEILFDMATVEKETPIGKETVRLKMKDRAGKIFVFTDYASCGKEWYGNDYKTSVWIKQCD